MTNLKFYILQNYLSKIKEKYRHSQTHKRLSEFVALEEMVKKKNCLEKENNKLFRQKEKMVI